MSPQKETVMILKVDLGCPRCYKKVKKLLCSIPQIRDQIYNEKQNTVMIKVVCCSPEKIRDKIRCKGGKTIKDIQIMEPPKPPAKPAEPPKPPAKPAEPPKPAPQPKPEPPKPKPEPPKPATEPKPKPPPPPSAPVPTPPPKPIPCFPPAPCPRNVCCPDCYQGRTTGPCYNGYGYGCGCGCGCGTPPPPPPAGGWGYDDCCPPGRYSYRPGYCVSRCADYINDENPMACAIM